MAKVGRPPKKTPVISKHLHIRIEDAAMERIRAAAELRGQSVTVFVLRAVEAELAKGNSNDNA